MATNILYEGDGFLRSGPAFFARSVAKTNGKTADPKVVVDAESADIESREKALRREFLPEWVCRLLEA
ncbi:MAG: hypothetical protein ACKVQK_19605 [Burkholderiales bacterium]